MKSRVPTRVLEREHQHQAQDNVDEHGDDADAHRGLRVLARVKAGRQNFNKNEREQSSRERHQRFCAHAHVVGVERPVMKQRRQHRPGEYHQRDRRRQADEHHPAQCPVEQVREFLGELADVFTRQAWQDHGGQRDAEHAERKFHDAIGIIKPGHAAGHQKRGQQGIDQQVYLRGPKRRKSPAASA